MKSRTQEIRTKQLDELASIMQEYTNNIKVNKNPEKTIQDTGDKLLNWSDKWGLQLALKVVEDNFLSTKHKNIVTYNYRYLVKALKEKFSVINYINKS